MNDDSAHWLERIRAAGDTAERRALHARYFAGGPPRKVRAARARGHLVGQRTLDLGCGFGVYLARFEPRSVGLDRDEERVRFVRSLGLDARVADLEADDWAQGLGRFDRVWACDILPHVHDPARLLAACAPLLEEGGCILVSDWLWPTAPALEALALRLPGARAVHDEPTHFQRPTFPQVATWARQAGFEVAESWIPSFRRAPLRLLLAPIWPPRTLVLRPV